MPWTLCLFFPVVFSPFSVLQVSLIPQLNIPGLLLLAKTDRALFKREQNAGFQPNTSAMQLPTYIISLSEGT